MVAKSLEPGSKLSSIPSKLMSRGALGAVVIVPSPFQSSASGVLEASRRGSASTRTYGVVSRGPSGVPSQ